MVDEDIIVRSKTQDAETIQRALEDDGFGEVEVDGKLVTQVEDDSAPAAAAPVVEETSVVVDPDDDDDPPPAAEGHPPAKKHRPGSKDRKINRLGTELETERAARLKMETELAELKARMNGPALAAAPVKTEPAVVQEEDPFKDIPAAKTKPKYEDFADADDPITAFADARDEWKDQDIDRQRLIREAKQKQEDGRKSKETSDEEAKRKAAADEVGAREAPAKQKYSDYGAKVDAVTDCPSVLVETINSFSSMPGEVKYYLATHPEEYQRIKAKVAGEWKDDKDRMQKIGRSHAELLLLEEKIEAELKAAHEVDDDQDDLDDEVVDPVVEPPAPAPAAVVPPAPKPAEPRRNATPPTPKPPSPPHSPVGSRKVGSPQKRVQDMSPDELRDMSQDDYRKAMYPETVGR